jgi:hypothetical protein
MGRKRADLVIRGNIVIQHVINMLYLYVDAGLDPHQLSVKPAGLLA